MNCSKFCRAWAATIIVVIGGCSLVVGALPARSRAQIGPTSDGQSLSLAGKLTLHSYLDSDSVRLPSLNHPDFLSYQQEAREFYRDSNDELPWVVARRPSPQALELIRIFENAEDEALNPIDYDCRNWEGRLAELQAGQAPESALVQFDLAVTISAMRYVSDLHLGRVNPRQFHYELDLGLGPGVIDLSEFLRLKLVHAVNVASVMQSVEPPFPAYKRTLEALRVYRQLAPQDSSESLPVPRKTVHPGDSYSALAPLARRLELLGDLPPLPETAIGSTTSYSGVLVDGIRHFQERHGLDPDGAMGKDTFNELNVPLAQRIEQLELTLERWRWVPHAFAGPPVVVNLPEFRLHVDDPGYHWLFSMKVVVGSAYRHHETPVFAGLMRSVIFRPYWNVPISIQRAELIGEVRRHPSYLADHSFEVVNGAGGVVDSRHITDELMRGLESGRLAIRQRPGPNNALGLLKFEFPNVHDVYLHGTPATELFSRSRRDFSHGCIRVEDPVRLAEWVLKDDPEWTHDRIVEAMNGNRTLRVNLKKPIPVIIAYGTAIVMEDGEVRFFDDIYGYDAELQKVISRGYPYERRD